MKRYAYSGLKDWKSSAFRKPLIIQGARQVGKTWLMKEFGRNEYENVIYLNFESSDRLRKMFVSDFDIERILLTIEIESKQKVKPTTLIIFDEIQEAEKGLTVLKYFYENAPQYHIIAAGSLLGVSIQKDTSFPVGKVDFLQLYPMSFLEFLENCGEDKMAQQIRDHNWSVVDVFHEKVCELLRMYYFIGGMPEAVARYIQTKDLSEVRSIQERIILGYENDFAKHAPSDIVPKIRLVWNAILSQLAKENRKFVYGQIKKGARAKDFELAINWLVNAGLLIKVSRISKPAFPLTAYADFDSFKLFLMDVGMLNAMGKLDQKIVLEKNAILTEFKGAMTEQFVAQQLKIHHELYYWSATNGRAEIDFVIQNKNEAIPIEVKAEENLMAKSLKVFKEKYDSKRAIRMSMSRHRQENWLTNVPLYAAMGISDTIN